MSEEDRAKGTGNMQKKIGKDRVWFRRYLADKQTDQQTDILVTILRNRNKVSPLGVVINELKPDMVTHPSTNGARRRLTSSIKTNALAPLRQTPM